MDLSSVRIREHFGLVSNNTHTGQFSFLISPPKNRSGLEKHDYILLDHPLFGEVCQILAVITDITSYEEVAGGSSVGDKMGKMLATAEIVGYADLRNENKPLCEVLVPPNPGGRVYVPLKKFLEDILNRNTKGENFKDSIEIGTFENSSAENQENQGRIKCYLDGQDLTSKHTLIAAGPGAGKTHLGKLLLQEISTKISTQIILFDSYNEYSSVIETAKVELNGKTDKDSLSKMIKKGSITVLNAQGMELEQKRSFFLESLQIILKLRLENKITPSFLIIEEAENLKGEVLNQAVAEGRKIGISICLLTTNPSDLGGKILSQMGYQIIGKTTNKEDIAYLSNIAGATNEHAELAVGEWIISGISNNRPTKVRLI